MLLRETPSSHNASPTRGMNGHRQTVVNILGVTFDVEKINNSLGLQILQKRIECDVDVWKR